MRAEYIFNIFFIIIVMIGNIIGLIDKETYFMPLMVSDVLAVLYFMPRIKKYKEKLNIKKKSKYVEGQIYDIIICYQMIYLQGYESPEAREYPVIMLRNDKGEWEKIIANESDTEEYKVGDNIKIWYRYGRKERIQISYNTFLNKTYKKINISEKAISTVDSSFLEDEITIYHKNTEADLSEYKNTLIMNGKNLIIEKIK